MSTSSNKCGDCKWFASVVSYDKSTYKEGICRYFELKKKAPFWAIITTTYIARSQTDCTCWESKPIKLEKAI